MDGCVRVDVPRGGGAPTGAQHANKRHRDGVRQPHSMMLERTMAAQGRRVTSYISPQAGWVEGVGPYCLAPLDSGGLISLRRAA
jgi:hypothetical protein